MYRLSPPGGTDVPASRARAAFPGGCRAGALAFALLACTTGGAFAQPDDASEPSGESATSMSLEELEEYIEEQKAALEAVRENRENVAKKTERVDERLAEREARQDEIRAEMETLCAELAKVEPGRAAGCTDDLDEDRDADAVAEDGTGEDEAEDDGTGEDEAEDDEAEDDEAGKDEADDEGQDGASGDDSD